MIQVVIEMEEAGGTLNIKAAVPAPIAFAVVTAAYHELLSAKIRDDLKAEQRVQEPDPATVRRLTQGYL